MSIGVVATGGTIQNTPSRRVPLDTVLDRVRTAYEGVVIPDVDLVIRDILRAGSETFGYDEWQTIATTAQQLLDEGVDGLVVTHGTFTAEETAYLLHLVLATDRPVAVTVSQRKHGTLGNDGDRNLIDALRTVTTGVAAGLGVVLVANEEIHCAREVTKENQRPGAFTSSPVGPLGTIETDAVSLYRAPLRAHTRATPFEPAILAALPRVEIVPGYAGADQASVEAALKAGAAGIVLAGFAYSGRGSDPQMEALRSAYDAGIAVVLTSRGRGGRIPSTAEHPFARGDNLTPQKARILTALALASGASHDALQPFFDRY